MKRKYLNLTFVIMVLLGWKTSTLGQDTIVSKSYSLNECIAFALENHESIKNAILDYEISKSKVKQTRGLGFPQIEGNYDVVDNFKIQKQFLPANTFNPQAPEDLIIPIEFGLKYSSNLSVTLSQLIFDGSYIVGLQAAKVYTDLFDVSTLKTKVNIVEAVKKSYYASLVTDRRLSLMESNVVRLDKLYEDTKILKEGGFVQSIDLQRIAVARNNVKTEMRKLHTFSAMNYDMLKFQMGLPISEEISLSENLETNLDQLSPVVPSSGNPELRPEYRILEVTKKLNELELKNDRFMKLPSVGAFLRGGVNNGQNELGKLYSENHEDYLMGGFSLSIPIFSGTQSLYKVQQSKLKIKKAENDLQMLRRSVALEATQSAKSFNDNFESLKIQEENITLAEEVYRVSKVKYQEGVGSNLEVIEAENALKEAQTNYYAAVYDLLLSKVALDKASGILLTE